MTAIAPEAVEELVITPYEKTDDPSTKTHVVHPEDNLHIYQEGMTPLEVVEIARNTGQEVMALCGYKFVPKHDPDAHDACEPCMKLASLIIARLG